jgi:hypothetical protein
LLLKNSNLFSGLLPLRLRTCDERLRINLCESDAEQ